MRILWLAAAAAAAAAFVAPAPHVRLKASSRRTAGSPLSTPHAGSHWNGRSKRRFMEGWYFRVTIPDERASFCWMYSIENPAGGPGALVGAQVLGPDDGYVSPLLLLPLLPLLLLRLLLGRTNAAPATAALPP